MLIIIIIIIIIIVPLYLKEAQQTPTDADFCNLVGQRLVHAEDMNAAAAFVVDPDTHQLYGAYGRGHLSQMERQKLMTGKKSRFVLNYFDVLAAVGITSS